MVALEKNRKQSNWHEWHPEIYIPQISASITLEEVKMKSLWILK